MLKTFVIVVGLTLTVGALLLGPRLRPTSAAETRLSKSDVSVLVRGCAKEELQRILVDFDRKYDLAETTFEVEIGAEGLLRIRLLDDLDRSLFLFLVNYLHYPEELDLTDRQIAAVGQLRIAEVTGMPADTKPGELTWIYVPTDDQEYDLVYARRENGLTYQISFTDLSWKPVADPRLSAETLALMHA